MRLPRKLKKKAKREKLRADCMRMAHIILDRHMQAVVMRMQDIRQVGNTVEWIANTHPNFDELIEWRRKNNI